MPHRKRGERFVLVGVVICLMFMAIAAYSLIAMRNLGESLYQECLGRQVYDQRSNEARAIQVGEFRQLAAIVATSPIYSPSERAARIKSYNEIADALQRAVDSAVEVHCVEYRAPNLWP